VLADERERIAGAEQLLVAQATDAHPRVRTEAVRGLSFYPTSDAMAAVVAAANVTPEDKYVSYTCDAALGANLDVWKSRHAAGQFAAKDSPAERICASVLGLDKIAAEMAPHLKLLLSEEPHPEEQKNKSLTVLAGMTGGDRDSGRIVFRRVCANCHKVGSEGAELGPELTKVATRLDGYKLLESIIYPNAAVDEKYLSTMVLTDDGRSIVGLLVSETPEELVIFDGKEHKKIPVAEIDERTKLKQSSMPDGLAGTLSPPELLDVVEYLRSLK